MNRLLSLLLAASCLDVAGQVDFPWNPDGNLDGVIGVHDLQDLLSGYGSEFQLVDSTEYWSSQVNASSCFIAYSYNGHHHGIDAELDFHYAIPSSCSVVHLTTNYYYNSIGQNTARDLRLPTENLCVGQIVSFIFHPQYGVTIYETGSNGWTNPGKIEIMAYQDDSWVEVGALFDSDCDSPGCYTDYFLDTATNEKFMWTGESWLNLDTPAQLIQASPND